MFAGHFAIGMAIKARMPRVPSVPILIGVGFLDILDGLFVIAGWNRVTPDQRGLPALLLCWLMDRAERQAAGA